MSEDTNSGRPSVRFRDRFSHFKDRVKDKVKDKAIKHNITLFVHHNYTLNESDGHSTRHGFRQQMHHIKDVMKNKTHYDSLKEKIKEKIDDKFDIHDNKTYPKGFYDSLFSPDTENDVYLQTGLVCLWVIAVLCIIPTLVIIFLPAKTKKKGVSTSTNMIFFHVFLCEVFYLFYVFLAMINVSKDFRLGSFFCDIANYGMYVTIPIMQFTLLFLTLERLSQQFNLPMTWAKIFTKPYLINVILCVIWVILIALLVTFMLIKKQFSFNIVKDKISSFAPPIVGEVVTKLASRRHHCSVDGRLSSVFKTLIIVLFVFLIVKPILISLGFHVLTPFCCKGRRNTKERHGDRRTTKLVTIFLLLNLFFSFPFYFVSMFKSVFSRFDATKETFNIILKVCFILRITNIIFECLAFYIFERNSWNLLSKLFYYGTCKKFPILNSEMNDDVIYTKNPAVKSLIKDVKSPSDDDDEEEVEEEKPKEKKKPVSVKEEGSDDDGAFTKPSKKKPPIAKAETPPASEEEEEKHSNKKTTDSTTSTKRKSKVKEEVATDEDEPKPSKITKRKSQSKPQESDDDEEATEIEQVTETTKHKSRTKKPRDDQEHQITRRKTPPRTDDDQEEQPATVEKSKSRPANGRSSSHSHARRSTQPSPTPNESEEDPTSDASHTSTKMIQPSKSTSKTSRKKTKSSSASHSHHSTKKPTPSGTKKTRKHPKKDRITRMLEMSDEV